MKIGILTVPFNNNYGGFLQAYALKTVLEKMGHNVLFINRQRNPSKSLKFLGYRLLVKLHLIKDFIGDKKREISANTDVFKKKYLSPISPAYYSSKELKDCLKYGLDLLIVGSDQVWRYKYSLDSIDDFYFGFISGDNPIPRISYAASFGTDIIDYPNNKIRIIKPLLTRFRAISVREESGIDLLTKFFGVPASKVQAVLDPTLLLNVFDYLTLFQDINNEAGDYVFTYILDREIIGEEVLDQYITKKCLRRIDGKAQTGDLTSLKMIEPVEKWLSNIYYADFVITDSFHGTVFSILFNKPFISIANPVRGITRLQDLLSRFGLKERLVTNLDSTSLCLLDKQIDWESVNCILNERKEESLHFLIESIRC